MGHAGQLACPRAAEDHVEHLLAAEALGRLLADSILVVVAGEPHDGRRVIGDLRVGSTVARQILLLQASDDVVADFEGSWSRWLLCQHRRKFNKEEETGTRVICWQASRDDKGF